MTKPTTVVIKGELPGEAVDRHLKTYGHLPNTKLCDEKGSCMPKLDKAQEKRFDEFVEEHHTTTQVEPRLLPEDKAKQHLAKELDIQKKEITTRNELKRGYCLSALEKAIKAIK